MPRIDARSKTIRELLENQKYGIDEFQREYRWDDRNIQELLEDFETGFKAVTGPIIRERRSANTIAIF